MERGDGGSDVAWVESRGAVLDRRNGREQRERRGFSPLFLFSVRWLGVGAIEKWFFDRECF